MPYWVYIPDPEGGMPGLLGPYTGLEARKKADKLDEDCEVLHTLHSDELRAKREIKEQLIDERGYQVGRKRIQAVSREDY